ncbi:MAG: glycosyltransferase family 1 protein, partial [Candidatus Beckwithbacteria bacterium]
MKIGIDISQIVYQTGVSRYTVELVKHLLELDPNNHYYLYAGSLRQRSTLRAFIKSLDPKKISSKISYLSPKLLDIFWNSLNLFSPDCCQKLDIFHASNWAIPKTNCKLVTTIHDLTFLKYKKSHLPYSIKAHTRHLNRAKKYADHIITDSFSTKKDLVEYGIKAEKISVIYPAPAKLFKKETNPKVINKTLAKYSLDLPFVLSVGTQEPRKNIKRLIKAYQSIKPKHNKLTLAIAGKFGWGDAIKPVLGVNLLGFVPDEDLKILYSAAKVFVYPSLYEGFG